MPMVWHRLTEPAAEKCGAKLQIIFSVCKTLHNKLCLKKFDFQ